MENKLVQKVLGVGLIVIILCLTLIREDFFLEINSLLDQGGYKITNGYLLNGFFNTYTIAELKMLKWVFVALFSFGFTGLSIVGVYIIYRKKKYTKIIFQFYIIVFLFLFVIGIISYLLGFFNEAYFVLRKIIGFIHSPLPIFIFLLIFYSLSTRNK